MHIEEISDKIEICAYCPLMCQDICTVFSETKIQSRCPTMQQYILWLILNGKETYSKEIAEIIYECCCSCLLCQSWCATNQDVPEKVRAARRDVVELNYAPQSVVHLNEATLKSHNPYGEPHDDRFRKIAAKAASKDSDADLLYFVGCTTAYRRPEIANAVTKILQRANLSFDLMKGEEWCCGLPQWDLGLETTTKTLAEHNSNYINKSNHKIVLTSCPECYYMLKEVYPSLGFPIDPEICHASEYLARLIGKGKLSVKGFSEKKMTYHDPCYLGRYANIFDAPRDVIKTLHGIDFVEMRWIKDKAYCCGGNEGFAMIHPELSARISGKVVDEAQKIEAEGIITACPMCKELLRAHATDKNIEIYDLTELVAKLL
ncbi:MAG: (Fe-S)-binding protein [Nitrososphaeria archaeon]